METAVRRLGGAGGKIAIKGISEYFHVSLETARYRGEELGVI